MRFYRALLRLYPESFRADYAAELGRTFDENVHNRGRISAMIAAVADVVPNALAVHWTILLQDLRFTARTLNGSRGFAIAAVLITALGVGANTATFSVADFVLLRPLPYKDPSAIVRLCEGPRDGSGWGCMNELSPANFRSAATETRSFEEWGAFTGASVNMVGSGEPVRIGGYRVTPEVFSVLGVPPMIGRTFDTTSAGAADASSLVLSWALWQTQFGGDTQVLGKTLRLDGTPYTVIGVMPRTFQFPDEGARIWMPLILRDDDFLDRGDTYLQAVGRLKEGVTFEQAGLICPRCSIASLAIFLSPTQRRGSATFANATLCCRNSV